MPLMIKEYNPKLNSISDFNNIFKGKHTLDVRRYQNLEKLMSGNTKKILDVGCAEGYGIEYLAKFFPNFLYNGCDISSVAIENAKKRCPFAKFNVFDVVNDGIDGEYDYILFIHILEHLFDPFLVLKKFMLHCKEKVIIEVPKYYFDEGGRHYWHFEERDFLKNGVDVLLMPELQYNGSKNIFYANVFVINR